MLDGVLLELRTLKAAGARRFTVLNRTFTAFELPALIAAAAAGAASVKDADKDVDADKDAASDKDAAADKDADKGADADKDAGTGEQQDGGFEEWLREVEKRGAHPLSMQHASAHQVRHQRLVKYVPCAYRACAAL